MQRTRPSIDLMTSQNTQARIAVDRWNEQHPIGTAVKITNAVGIETHTTTTSIAMVFAKTDPVVWIKFRPPGLRVGFINLNRLVVV